MPSEQLEKLLQGLNEDARTAVLAYKSWRDQQATLLGKFLLGHALNRPVDKLMGDLLEIGRGKPALKNGPAFNISHSGDWVVLAVGFGANGGLQVGVDIQQVKKVPVYRFENAMSLAQWAEIQESEYPSETLFKLWAMKEAVIKADGNGLAIELDTLEINPPAQCMYGNTIFHVKSIPFKSGYAAAVAANAPFEVGDWQEIKLTEIIP